MIRHVGDLPVLRELREALQGLYGDNLSRIILYGSRARGDADPFSDYDVLIVLCQLDDPVAERERIAPALSRLSLEYDTVLSGHVVSDEEYQHRPSPLFMNIRREGTSV